MSKLEHILANKRQGFPHLPVKSERLEGNLCCQDTCYMPVWEVAFSTKQESRVLVALTEEKESSLLGPVEKISRRDFT